MYFWPSAFSSSWRNLYFILFYFILFIYLGPDQSYRHALETLWVWFQSTTIQTIKQVHITIKWVVNFLLVEVLPSICKNATSVKHNKGKHNKTRYAFTGKLHFSGVDSIMEKGKWLWGWLGWVGAVGEECRQLYLNNNKKLWKKKERKVNDLSQVRKIKVECKNTIYFVSFDKDKTGVWGYMLSGPPCNLFSISACGKVRTKPVTQKPHSEMKYILTKWFFLLFYPFIVEANHDSSVGQG